jgi:exopolyphosphatase/guanosine-5'-triphosphate,3'-diphosphate pyrophosphatase
MDVRYGLMDIGSNTIHAVVYEFNGQKWRKVLSEKEYAELISYVEEQQLTPEGIDRLCQAIESLGQVFQVLACNETIYFATSALRALTNREAVLQQVKEQTGVTMTIISGQEEAYYDYVSLQQYIKQPKALGLDLGGGSGQLFYYQEQTLVTSASYEIGCLRLYNQYVSGVLPSAKERNAICKQVRQLLREGPELSKTGMDTLYVMGGTGRACAKLFQSLQGLPKAEDGCWLTLAQLRELLTTVQELGLHGVRIMNRLFPERLCSMVPGLLAIMTVAEYAGVKRICIIKEGLREGVLRSKFLKED